MIHKVKLNVFSSRTIHAYLTVQFARHASCGLKTGLGFTQPRPNDEQILQPYISYKDAAYFQIAPPCVVRMSEDHVFSTILITFLGMGT